LPSGRRLQRERNGSRASLACAGSSQISNSGASFTLRFFSLILLASRRSTKRNLRAREDHCLEPGIRSRSFQSRTIDTSTPIISESPVVGHPDENRRESATCVKLCGPITTACTPGQLEPSRASVRQRGTSSPFVSTRSREINSIDRLFQVSAATARSSVTSYPLALHTTCFDDERIKARRHR
jgi:hypothetical protein